MKYHHLAGKEARAWHAGVQLSLEKDAEQVQQYEQQGTTAAAKCAFVLVAGGLGERLGYHGIKVCLLTDRAMMHAVQHGRELQIHVSRTYVLIGLLR